VKDPFAAVTDEQGDASASDIVHAHAQLFAHRGMRRAQPGTDARLRDKFRAKKTFS
jgi:hypothetical protein